MEVLLSKDALGEKLVYQALLGDLEIVRSLINDNRDLINYQAQIDGFTPLIAAAWNRQVDVVVYLVAEQADVNIQDLNGRTALHHAAQKNFWEIIGRLFVRNDILVNKKDIHGNTPAHLAAKADQEVCAHLIITHQDFKNKRDAQKQKFYSCFSTQELQDKFKELYNQIARHH
ncbi:ankyrin repeat domain-containing protein [Candidatus Dependentiae bacterium]|jgi:ankyrin repeat protein|nr:ankyrin repeat domain-containing protein [Candidatus Dependentiae bacterium]